MNSATDTSEFGFVPGQDDAGGDFVPIAVRPRSPGEIWLDGNVVLCACPDCRAPMSVRFWLMMADCWRCGTTIELSEEQERQVEQLLAERPQPEAAPPMLPPPAPLLPRPGGRGSGRADLSIPAQRELRPPAPITPVLTDVAYPEAWLRRLLDVTPAWLVSMLVHLILFTLLALLTMEQEPPEGPFITLSAVLNRKVSEGGDAIRIRHVELAQFDLPLPTKADLNDDRQRNILLVAAQDARELRLDDDTPNLPDLRTVKSRVSRVDGYELALAARDPRLRAEIVTQEGGTTLTEAAVARGLKWLANHQNRDGSWSLAGFRHAGNCNCGGDGLVRTKSPGTALALLPFLGAGQTHLAGRYRAAVSRGLRWLIDHQQDDGDLRAGAGAPEGMYAHGQAAIVLCEAFAMTGDEALRGPAQKAIQFIVDAQYNDGGWRYEPRPRSQRGDTSVVGWQVMALQSGRAAGLNVPDDTWELADAYLDGVQQRDGALYLYQPEGDLTPAMTAEALLCRMYMGWKNDRPGLVRGIRWLNENHVPSIRSKNIYYWYYATQVMHHHGGPEWEEWNVRMRDILVRSQEKQGHAAGSWDPHGDRWGDGGGRIYMTALAVCTLEVYYRHLPIFRQIELE